MTKFYLFSRYLTVLLVFVATAAWSQSKTVTGSVKSSDDGSGLPGVNIVEKGTTNGTISSADGSYSIDVPENATLVFSFVGYKSQEAPVGGRSTISVLLEPDVMALSEVVVIGYGEVNKRDATGAVASVKADEFNRGVIASPEQLIQGKTAGVQITSSSGEPGAGVNLRIRGTSSVRGGNNPLFVVDGVPLTTDNVSPGGSDFGRGTSSAKNPLNFINPNDIESIDILKDASATAIYGSRGANGVVIITTKSGKGKSNSLEYSASLSLSEQRKKYDVLSGPQFIEAYSDYGNATLLDFGANTDWQEEVNRTAISHNHNLSYGDSYKTGNFRVSLSHDNQEGIIKNSGMKRYTGRLNFNQNFLNEKLKFSTQILFSRVDDEAAPITNSAGFEGDLIATSIFYNPTIPAIATNNVPLRFGGEVQGDGRFPGDAANPLSLLKYYRDYTRTDRSLMNFTLGYDITDELNVKVNTGFDRSNSLRTSAMSGLQNRINNVIGNGRAFLTDQENDSDLLEAYLTYDKKLGENSLNVLLGYSYQDFVNDGRNASAANFGDQTSMDWMIEELIDADQAVRDYIGGQSWYQYEYQEDNRLRIYDLFANPPTVTEITVAESPSLPLIGPRGVTGRKFSSKDELQSFFARANYNMGEKYFFTASFRADGSSRFGSNKKYGLFPSAAVKWRMSEEDFVPEAFDDLSVRLGFGITGNQSFGHHLYSTRQQYGNLGLNNDGTLGNTAGLVYLSFGNPDLQWEQTSQINLGFDYAFLSSRIYGSLDLYRKNTTDLLMQTFSAQPAPTQFIWENLDANVINSGVEFSINAIAAQSETFEVNVGFNLAYNKNMVKNYEGAPLRTGVINGQGLTGAYAQRIANDQPLFSYYVRPFTGFAENGLNKPEEDYQTFVGKSAIPKWNGGLSLSARYKGFDVQAYFNGQFGHYIYNNVANAMFTKGSLGSGRNVTPDVVTSNESVGNAPDVSERFLEKGDFIRFQNLGFGYSYSLSDNKVFSRIRVSVTGQNLAVLTDYSGLDPEVNVDKNIDGVPSLGIDYTAYPRARTVTFGLTATF